MNTGKVFRDAKIPTCDHLRSKSAEVPRAFYSESWKKQLYKWDQGEECLPPSKARHGHRHRRKCEAAGSKKTFGFATDLESEKLTRVSAVNLKFTFQRQIDACSRSSGAPNEFDVNWSCYVVLRNH